MTHTDFNHLLSSIKALSPEQVRQLRQQLDRQLAQPKKPAAPAPGKAAKRAKPAAARRSRSLRRSSISTCSASASSARFPIPPWTSTTTTPTISPSPSRESRCRKPSSASGAEVATAYFVDSSALVKRYVQEAGTAWVRGITRHSPSTIIYIARITAVEVTSAVARRRKGRTLTSARASSILHRFRQHLAGRYAVVEITPALFNDAMRLANTHALRAYDAVQLAAALEIHQQRQKPWIRPGDVDFRRPGPQRRRHRRRADGR